MKASLTRNTWLLLAVLTIFCSACNNDDDAEPSTQTIVEIINDDSNFSTLAEGLDRVGLIPTLEGTGPFTVLAPTNNAFAILGTDLSSFSDEELREILLYHLLGDALESGEFQEGQTYVSTGANTGPNDNQLSLLVEKEVGDLTLNGIVSVTRADIQATNGVIHEIDEVLMPLDLVGHAVANRSFTTLLQTVGNAEGNLINVLQGTGPYTVFAPVNSAFQSQSSDLDGLTPAQIAEVITYHVVSGNVRSSALSDGMTVTPLNTSSTFIVNTMGGVSITDGSGQDVMVLLTDVQTTNGVIHILGGVLIPDNL